MKKFICFITLLLLAPLSVYADGGLIPPPNYHILESDQRAVIFFENNTETLVVSTKFQGDAENFAWIIPTPTQPQVEKSTVGLFNSLNNLTSYTRGVDYFNLSTAGLGSGSGEIPPPPVEVLETKQIEYFDITVLKASDPNALNNWLNEHNYKFPSSANYVLDHYINNDWYFTTVKISGDYLSNNLNQATRSGDLIPLSLTFSTEKIVFPLKISSVDYYYEEDNKELGFYINRYKPIFDFLLTKNNSQYPSIWQDDYSTIFKIIDATRLQLQKDIQYQVNYTDSVAAVTDFITEAEYNEMLNIAKSYGTTDLNDPEYFQSVSLMVNSKTPELGQDIQTVSPLANRSITSAKQEIALWPGKVNQHFENGQWVTDPDGHSGALVNKLTYCRKWYPGTTEVILDDIEYIEGFRNAGNTGSFSAEVQTYKCYGGTTVSQKYFPNKPSSITINLYIIADKVYEYSDFDLQYADYIKKADLENLASKDNGDPWLSVSKSKYVLTRLNKNISQSEMTNDLYFKEAANQLGVFGTHGTISFYIFMVIAVVLTLAIGVILIFIYHKH